MNAQIEQLEPRRLMAGNWATADEFQLAAGQTSASTALATDPAGNVFAAGFVTDATGATHEVIREKPAGTSEWATVWEGALPLNQINEFAVEADGDMYVAGRTSGGDNWMVMAMRPSRGDTMFSVIDDPGAADAYAWINALVVDQATGNVFSVGKTRTQVGVTTGPGKKTSPVYSGTWIVRKQTAGEGAFRTVDTFTSGTEATEAFDVAVVPTGPLSGVYVVGSATLAGGTWFTRRSSGTGSGVGDAGTWGEMDRFQYDALNGGSNTARGVASDAAGNLYVAGQGSQRTVSGGSKKNPTYTTQSYWLTRRYAFDAGHGAYGWATLDAIQMPSIPADLAVAGDGSIYLIGNYQDRNEYGTYTDHHAVTRSYRKVNDAWQWQTDDYQFVADRDTIWTSAVVDATGTAYVGGSGRGEDGGYHWLVRSLLA